MKLILSPLLCVLIHSAQKASKELVYMEELRSTLLQGDRARSVVSILLQQLEVRKGENVLTFHRRGR